MSVMLDPAPRPVLLSAAEAIDRLAFALRQYGFARLYTAHGDGISVLSITCGLTVWCHEGVYGWRTGGRWTFQRADAPENTALLLIQTRPTP